MTPTMPSDRKFGWTFTALFILMGAFYQPWLIALAAVLAAITATRAHWLAPLKHAWMKLGDVLNRVVSPIVLGAIFFAIFTPAAMAMRMLGRDAMKRRFEPAKPTYWERRDPPGPADDSFRQMF